MALHPYLDGPHPRAYAHRGWHIDDLAGMENTMVAFQRAVAEGYRYVELDVHACADGVAVVHHDAALDRTTDGHGRIARLPAAVVAQARVGGREPVPTLEQVLAELPRAKITIELKSDAVVLPVLRVLATARAWDRVCLGSVSEARLERARRVGGARLLTSLGQRSAVGLRARAWMDRAPVGPTLPGLPVRGGLAQLPHRLGILTVVDPALLRAARRLGIEVHVWTVNDPAAMRALLDLGVDGLLTDRPDLLREILRARGEWPA